MEEEKVTKKNNMSLLLMAAAAIFILVGVGLILTGNNKSFMGKDEPQAPKEETPDNTETEPPRAVVPTVITVEEISQLIDEKRQLEFADENWVAQSIKIVGHDPESEKFLVSYDEVDELGNLTKKQTIVTVLADSKYVELPGWNEGERDLTVYNRRSKCTSVTSTSRTSGSKCTS